MTTGTAPIAAPSVSLDDLRQRYLDAEAGVQAAAATLAQLDAATRQFADGGTALREAGGELARLRGGFEAATRAVAGAARTLGDGAESLHELRQMARAQAERMGTLEVRLTEHEARARRAHDRTWRVLLLLVLLAATAAVAGLPTLFVVLREVVALAR